MERGLDFETDWIGLKVGGGTVERQFSYIHKNMYTGYTENILG